MMMAQVQTEATIRPIITSLTIRPACMNRPQIEWSAPGAARTAVSMCLNVLKMRAPHGPGGPECANPKIIRKVPSHPLAPYLAFFRAKFGERKASPVRTLLRVLVHEALWLTMG